MKLLLTGATGYLGGFIAAEARAAGDTVVAMSRRAPDTSSAWLRFDLGDPPRCLPHADALVHAAFDHLPGRYRGGEGNDPDGFMARNRDGSMHLFRLAVDAGIGRIVFLSSRAVYGPHPPGTVLSEDMRPDPDTLYGRMKVEVENALARMPAARVTAVSLRVTGVYGQPAPRAWHKWADLFEDYAAGRAVAPRAGTEVHGADLAGAVLCVLKAPAVEVSNRAFNVSDLMIDRHDLLTAYRARTCAPHAVPPRAAGPAPNTMSTDRLRALGWKPGGQERLDAFLDAVTMREG